MTQLDEAQAAEVAQLVGVDPASDGSTIVAAVREALEEQAELEVDESAFRDREEQARRALGIVLVDGKVLDGMRVDRDELERLRAERDDQTIFAAMRKGFITPAQKAGWQAAMRRDPEATKAEIAQLKTPLVPMKALGYDDGGQ